MNKEFKEEVIETLKSITDCLRTISYTLGDCDFNEVYNEVCDISNNITKLEELVETT